MEKVLQFITNASTEVGVVEQVAQVLEGGCRWIQLRLKDFDTPAMEKVIERVKPMCLHHKATLIMNDRVDLAAKFKLDGVHVGYEDMPVAEARQILGDEAIIGVTANTIEDIWELSQQPMSYFGIGPMRFTTTKKNLKPLIGLSGYHKIVAAMRETGVTKPAVAVGGIVLDDVNDLLELGMWGIAVSGAIGNAPDIKETTRGFMKIINEFDTKKI